MLKEVGEVRDVVGTRKGLKGARGLATEESEGRQAGRQREGKRDK